MTEQKIGLRNTLKLIAIALSLYIIWFAATYTLEGRGKDKSAAERGVTA